MIVEVLSAGCGRIIKDGSSFHAILETKQKSNNPGTQTISAHDALHWILTALSNTDWNSTVNFKRI